MKRNNLTKPHTPLRVGFDLDGVLLYNPARTARPIIVGLKKIFLKEEIRKFHYPKTRLQKVFWAFLHKSSMFTAPGLKDIQELVKKKKIKAYIVTARYEFLKGEFQKWLNKIKADTYFEASFFNNNDEQPHIFKARMIKDLKLDVFVEDNWDIVKHLKNEHKNLKIFWISNIFDRNIPHTHKFTSLKKAVETIGRLSSSRRSLSSSRRRGSRFPHPRE